MGVVVLEAGVPAAPTAPVNARPAAEGTDSSSPSRSTAAVKGGSANLTPTALLLLLLSLRDRLLLPATPKAMPNRDEERSRSARATPSTVAAEPLSVEGKEQAEPSSIPAPGVAALGGARGIDRRDRRR